MIREVTAHRRVVPENEVGSKALKRGDCRLHTLRKNINYWEDFLSKGFQSKPALK